MLPRSLHLPLLLASAVFVTACEDELEPIFQPNTGEPPAQNGYTPAPPFVQPGTTSYSSESTGDSAGRAKFCDEGETTDLVQRMVVAPIIPDESIGTIPLRTRDGHPMHADELLGRPPAGFCDPGVVYSNGFSWGPTEEVIVLFNEDTRLVEGIIAYKQYLGALQGRYTDETGAKVDVFIKPRERVLIGDQELDEYTSRADQANRPKAWLNNKNVTKIYRMLRETFFDSPPIPENYDCIATQLCDLIYTGGNESNPQETVIAFRDSGVYLDFTPEGQIDYVYIEPVRKAPFETRANIRFGETGSSTMTFSFQSVTRPNCQLGLDESTFADFKQRCIAATEPRTLSRAGYNVETSRDAVEVAFEDISLYFLRKTSVSTSAVFKDGEPPKDTDKLYAIQFTRTLEAPVAEYKPVDITQKYRPKLHDKLLAALRPGGPVTPEQHPLGMYDPRSPFLLNDSQRIGSLELAGGGSYVDRVVKEIREIYDGLPEDQRAMVDPKAVDPLFIIEPFVDAVLAVMSHGESERPGIFKVFRTTDDRRWVIGYAHFFHGTEPYRMVVQYSMNYGAITAVSVERGRSEVDELLDGIKAAYGDPLERYFAAGMLSDPDNPYGLNGGAVTLRGFDRRLGTVTVELQTADPMRKLTMVVPGDPIEDRAGYFRQVRGERWEFVSSTQVRLLGKETQVDVWVEPDGQIGRAAQYLFKGSIQLCTGLSFRYGDFMLEKIRAWADRVSPNDYNDCEIVFNYSANGNILDSVASLKNKVEITAVDKRAVTAAVWR